MRSVSAMDIYMIECGKAYMGEEENYCLGQIRRYCSKQWLNLFRSIVECLPYSYLSVWGVSDNYRTLSCGLEAECKFYHSLVVVGCVCARKEEGGVGFHDLRCFNIVTLGKQHQCFITGSQSLLSRYFKAKY